MNESFGTRLRLQRERQQVDLTAISASTKISVTLLERLERDEVDRWPVGIFRRAYVRAYAAAIGLDPEAVLREFLELYPDSAALDPFSAAEAADEVAGRGSSTRLGKIVRSAMAVMPGFPKRPSRPEMSRVHMAMESADDRGTWDHDELPAPTVIPRGADGGPPPPDRGVGPASTAEAMVDEKPGGQERTVDTPPTASLDSASLDSLPASLDSCCREPDLIAAAALCTRFAQVREWHDVEALIGEAARVVEAIGLVVWAHSGRGDGLTAVLAHGYPAALIARLPVVPRTADNAIAAAFRSAHRAVVPSEEGSPGALVVPLLAASGCAGVLALELAGGAERNEAVAAFAEIVAAQLAPLVGATSAAEAVSA